MSLIKTLESISDYTLEYYNDDIERMDFNKCEKYFTETLFNELIENKLIHKYFYNINLIKLFNNPLIFDNYQITPLGYDLLDKIIPFDYDNFIEDILKDLEDNLNFSFETDYESTIGKATILFVVAYFGYYYTNDLDNFFKYASVNINGSYGEYFSKRRLIMDLKYNKDKIKYICDVASNLNVNISKEGRLKW